MSLRDCIDAAVREGRMTPEQADDLRARMDRFENELQLEYGPHAGEEAARRAFDSFRHDRLEARRRRLLTAKIVGQRLAEQRQTTDISGRPNRNRYLRNIVEDIGGDAGTSTVVQRYQALKGLAFGRMADLVQRFERDALGRTPDKAALRDVERAAFGEPSTEEAGALAKGWADAAEFLRRRFNAAGGHIPKRQDWGLPQMHDAVAVARAQFPTWRDFVFSRLDRQKMLDRATGQPLTDGQLELLLRDVYETIVTEGSSKMQPTGRPAGRSVALRRAEPRVLAFKGADAWMEYQEKFGSGNAFETMVGHIDAMARDVAAMEILGPNPLTGLRALAQDAEKRAKEMDAAEPRAGVTMSDRARMATDLATNTYDYFMGTTNRPVNAMTARVMSGTRNVLTSAFLGSAVISAMPSDAFMAARARAFAGLKQTRPFGDALRLMVPGNKDEKAQMMRAGLLAEGAVQVASAQARFLGEVNATGFTSRLADVTLRATGLSPWTQGARWTFQMEFLGNLAMRREKSLKALEAGDEVDQAFARTLRRYGLAGAWDEVRATQPYRPQKGVDILRPEDVFSRADLPPSRAEALGLRVLEMVQSETEYAVPSVSYRSRARFLGRNQRGTMQGELLRSTLMFKSFPVHMSQLMLNRVMIAGAEGGAQNAIGYVATMGLGLTLAGAISLQMKELSKGRDPRPMTGEMTGKFWTAAALQGGGLGIYGDFLFADVNRFGGGLESTFAGPVVGLANDVREVTVGNMAQAAAGDDMRLGRDTTRLLRTYTPFLGSAWYARLAYERQVLDQLQMAVDEDASEYFRRRERTREREQGQGYWWPEGARAPERMPQMR